MEPTSSKPLSFYAPKKVYTYMMQQNRQNQMAPSGSNHSTNDYIPPDKLARKNDGHLPPKDYSNSQRTGGHGEKKLPPDLPETNFVESQAQATLERERAYKASRGKTVRHLNLLAQHQKDLDEQKQQNPETDIWHDRGDARRTDPTGHVQEGAKKRPWEHDENEAVQAKRAYDKKLSLGKDMRNLMANQSDRWEAGSSQTQGQRRLSEGSMDCTSTITTLAPMQIHMDHREVNVAAEDRQAIQCHQLIGSTQPDYGSRILERSNGPLPVSGNNRSGTVDSLSNCPSKKVPSDMCSEITSSLDNQNRCERSFTTLESHRGQGRAAGDNMSLSKEKSQSEPCQPNSSVSLSKLNEQHVCMVCGDIAAGFHCGAYVCEACKKFFVRCLKQDVGNKFVCSRNKMCVVNRETRTQCQYCRYQKCLSLGMYKPGSGPGGGKFAAEISHIPCKVCESPSSGYHFGAITCEGCKGFFRRTVKERSGVRYVCSRNGSCNITVNTRNICKYCRYQKCLQAGMTPDGSRIGRQPNAVKHATMLELQRIQTHGSGTVEIKKEISNPLQETQDAVFSDSAQFELIDPSNLPEDLYLSDTVDGKLKAAGLKQVHTEEISDSLTRPGEQENRLEPVYHEPQNLSIPGNPGRLRGSYYNDNQHSQNILPESRSMNHILERNIGDDHHRQGDKIIQPSMVEYGDCDIIKQEPMSNSPQAHQEPVRIDLTGPTMDFAQEEHVRLLEYQRLQQLARIEALNAEQMEIRRQEQRNAAEIRMELTKLECHSKMIVEIAQKRGARDNYPYTSPTSLKEEQLSLPGGNSPHLQALPGKNLNNLDNSRHTSPDSARYSMSSESDRSPLETCVVLDPTKPNLSHFEDTEPITVLPHKTELKVIEPLLPKVKSPVHQRPSVSVSPQESSQSQARSDSEPTNLSTSNVPRSERDPNLPQHKKCFHVIEKLPGHLKKIVESVTQASLLLRPILRKSSDCKQIDAGQCPEEMWGTMMAQFGQCASSVIKFARKVPGFLKFPIKVQISKVQMSMYPIVLAVLSTQYNIKSQQYNYFHMSEEERNVVFDIFPGFKVLEQHFLRIGHSIKFMDMDDVEIAYLCSMILITSYAPGEEKESSMPHAESDLIDSLEHYCNEKEGKETGRDAHILARLAELNRCNVEHQKAVFEVKMQHSKLEIPQLFMETYLSA